MVSNNSNESLSNEEYLTQAEVQGQKEFDFLSTKPKPTFTDKMDAFLTDNVVGYTTIKEGIQNKTITKVSEDALGMYTPQEEVIKEQPITNELKSEVLKQALVPVEDLTDFDKYNNETDFYNAVGRYSNKKRAEELISSLPLTEQLAYGVITNFADIATWAAGGAIAKGTKLIGTAANAVGSSSKVLKALENGITVGGAIGTSEWLLQKENRVVEQDRLEMVTAFGAVLGAGIPMLPDLIKGTGSMTQQALASSGVQKAMTPVTDFIKKYSVLNPLDQIMNSATAPQWAKDFASKADVLTYTYRDSASNIQKFGADNAMGYRRQLAESYKDVIEAQAAEARRIGLTREEVDAQHSREYKKHETAVQDEVDRMIMTRSESELQTIYETATGTLLKTKRGKVIQPEDFLQVIGNDFKRQIEANPPKGLEVPAHLKYIYDFYAKFASEGTAHALSGLGGKTAFGYAPRGYDITAILKDAPAVSIKKFEEMLLANKLVQRDLLIAKGLKKQDILNSIHETAKYLREKAVDSDIRARYGDEGTGNVVKGTYSTSLRKMNLDTSLYPEYFSKSVVADAQTYADSMAGKLAMKKHYGIQSDGGGNISAKYKELKDKLIADGASPKDIENFKALFESVLGTRKISSDPHNSWNYAGKLGRKFAGAMYNAGFAAYSLSEVGSIVSKMGLVNTIKEFIPAHQRVIDSLKGLKKNDPLIGYMNDMGLARMVFSDLKHSRYEVADISHVGNRFERGLDEINSLGRKVSFFNEIQDTLDFMAGGAFLNDIRTLSTKLNAGGTLTEGQLNKFTRYGLDENDIKAFNNQDIQYHPTGNMVKDYNFYGWQDQALSKRTLQAMRNAVSETITRTDGTRVHRWQSEVDGFAPLLLQYTQYPAAAYEKLVLTMGEDMARTMTGAIVSLGISYTTLDMMDAALVHAGVKDVRTSSEDMAVKAFLKTPFSTIFPSIYDMIASAGGFTSTSGYTSKAALPVSPAVGTINKSIKNIKEAATAVADGDFKGVVSNVGENVPILNALWYFKPAFKALTGQTSREYGEHSARGSASSDFLLQQIESNSHKDTITHKLLGD